MKKNDKSITKFNHRFPNFQFTCWKKKFTFVFSDEEMDEEKWDILMKMAESFGMACY